MDERTDIGGFPFLLVARLQRDCKENETFSPGVITLTREEYRGMVLAMRLPMQAIEGTAVVGPFLWSSIDQDDEDPHLRTENPLPDLGASVLVSHPPSPVPCPTRSKKGRESVTTDARAEMIFRKSDVRKKGKTRGWEAMLSHSFRTRLTSGFVKGTSSSDIRDAMEHLKASAREVGHPLLLPIIILSYDLAPQNEERQRWLRDWLRKLENALTGRDEIEDFEKYFSQQGHLDLDHLNNDLAECNSQVLWKNPRAFLDIVAEMEVSLERYRTRAGEAPFTGLNKECCKLHRSMVGRLEFYKTKLKGIDNYSWTTLERIRVQREAVRPSQSLPQAPAPLSGRNHGLLTNHATTDRSTTTQQCGNPNSTSRWPRIKSTSPTQPSATAPP